MVKVADLALQSIDLSFEKKKYQNVWHCKYGIYVIGDNYNPVVRIRQIRVAYRLERLDGVASAIIFAGLEREIHIEIDLHKLQAHNLDLNISDEIMLGKANITPPFFAGLKSSKSGSTTS